MGDKMRERDTTISYINLLKRENYQKLMLLLNQYWSSAAFENGKVDNRKIVEVTKGICERSTTILKLCPAVQVLCEENDSRKRSNSCTDDDESKRMKVEGPCKENLN